MLRHSGKALWIRPGLAFAGLVGFAAVAVSAAIDLAFAQEVAAITPAEAGRLGAEQIVTLSALTGVVGFAVLSAIALIRARNRAETENATLRLEAGNLRAAADRAESLLGFDDQRLVIWEADGSAPLVTGHLPARTGVPADRGRFLAFGSWLSPDSAAELDAAIARLRSRGEAFSLALELQAGTFIEAFGRTAGGRAAIRFRDLTGDRLALAALEARHQRVTGEFEALKAALDGAPLPAWIRDGGGHLAWVNRAYALAVEARDPATAVSSSAELLDTAARQAIATAHARDAVYRKRLSAVSAGNRLILDVTDVVATRGSAGIAIDVSEVEASQATLRRLIDFHARTLDQLATAVAIFGPDRRLRSYNAAYRALFGLDGTFLDSMPDEGAILDRLRATRKLPEQADFRSWRADLLSAYQSLEAREQVWYMPDGQTLRVIANPHPQGGMTWIYENVTERLDLESRYNALIRVQGETLDHLAEGVAVFGSDGRLRLNNPAFARVWGLDPARLGERSHVSDLIAVCRRLHGDNPAWAQLTAVIAGFDETRSSLHGRIERADGRVIDYATVPLPEGQTMLTFVDVTDSVQVERALVDRNDALEASDRLKNAFIQHVSYELRSPLTNIIGFTQLLADAKIGPLNDKQQEYVGYIMSSSGSLLAIVNDILDLATIDAGIMALDLAETDVRRTVEAAVEGLGDRLRESRVRLETRIAPDVGTIVADEKRLRQILYNLLSNAVGFSPEGSRVTVTAERVGGALELSVADEGPGIPDDFLGSVFDRFESRASGAGRGGAGLGLSIVKSFVELHGGTVGLGSEPGRGTVVTVRLPVRPDGLAVEAAE